MALNEQDTLDARKITAFQLYESQIELAKSLELACIEASRYPDVVTKKRKQEELKLTSSQMERLIELYQSEVDLWNISSSNYHKKDYRQKALQNMTDNLLSDYPRLQCNVEQIQTKLSYLRGYYSRELAKINKSLKSGSGSDEIYKSPWAHFNTLDAFLRHQISPRVSQSNLVKGTALEARTKLLMTNTFMQKSSETIACIIGNTLPKTLEALNQQNKEMVTKYISDIEDMAEKLKARAIEIRQKYWKVHDCAQESKNYFQMRNGRASTDISAAETQLATILEYMDNITATLKFLKDETKAGEVFLRKLENPRYSERCEASLNRADQHWREIGKIFSDYMSFIGKDSTNFVNFLYGFIRISH